MTGPIRSGRSSGVVAGLVLLCGSAGTLSAQVAEHGKPPISVDAITDTPDAFIGHRVRFAGDVANVLGARVLTLKDQDVHRKEQILIVTRGSIDQLLGEGGDTLEEGDKVLVTGVVRLGKFADLEAELGVDIDAATERHFRGKPVVVVFEMVRTEGHEAEAPDTAHARN